MGLMGMGSTEFNPNGKVTRAEFWTVLSRVLWGNIYKWGTPYYSLHLATLQNAGIMKDISTPNAREIRGYVMLMMQRAGEVKTGAMVISENDNVENSWWIKSIHISLLEPFGQGEYIWELLDGKRNWQWEFTSTDWDKYIWEWENDKMNWQWTMVYSNWEKYIWEWKNGHKDWWWTYTYSRGEYYWKRENDRYIPE